jgi:hypothetical protein
MVVKFRNTICPPPPQLSLHRRAALSSNSNGTRSVYSRENPKCSLYCEMSVMPPHFPPKKRALAIPLLVLWSPTSRKMLYGYTTVPSSHCVENCGRFHRGGIIQGVLLYTMTPWKTPRKSMGEWDYRTRIIPLLSSMKPGLGLWLHHSAISPHLMEMVSDYTTVTSPIFA